MNTQASIENDFKAIKLAILIFCSINFWACSNEKNEPVKLTLTESAGDRATAYTMSNKVIHLKEGLLCSWIDVERINRWALVSEEGTILKSGNIGGPRHDNHCGVAMTQTPDGAVHAVLGAHHSPFEHYRFNGDGEGSWELVGEVGGKSTYPSLVSDKKGVLHLAYRCQKDSLWTLDYCKFENGQWSDPIALVESAKKGYIYWTNTLAVGPKNRLHLAFANSQPYPDGSQYHGASHLYSDDQGTSWADFGTGRIASFPVNVKNLSVLEGQQEKERVADTVFMTKYDIPGPLSKEYLHFVLSNLVIDEQGIPHLLYHNGLAGMVELRSFKEGKWQKTELMPNLEKLSMDNTGFRVHQQSALSLAAAGKLVAAIMLEPSGENEWGAPGTTIAYGEIDSSTGKSNFKLPFGQDSSKATWLPAIEHSQFGKAIDFPALLLTEGKNAGGFSANQNKVMAKVLLYQ